MNAIETHELTRRFWRTEAVHALDLLVPKGSVCALLGPNGAGKTTTLKMLVNLLSATKGRAMVLGVDSRALKPRDLARIGYLDEGQQTPDWMTVRQFLDYCRPFYPTWDRTLEGTLLRQFELPETRKLSQLSRGMRMKALLISVIAYRPDVLLMDEPFSGFDPVVREEVSQGLLEAARTGEWTVLLSSHDMEEVERLADRIVILKEGRKRVDEPVESLLQRFRRLEVNLQDGPAFPEAVSVPENWLGVRREGNRVTLVETAYSREATEAVCRRCFPEAAVRAQPMTLREIYVTLARGTADAEREDARRLP